MTLTQTDRILTRLLDGEPMCSFEPLRWQPPILRVAARIHNLRTQGFIVAAATCRQHVHDGRAVAYTLEGAHHDDGPTM